MTEVTAYCRIKCHECPVYQATINNNIEEKAKITKEKCGSKLNVKNCSTCIDYPCDKLNKVFDKSPEAKTTLENLRR
ncbi:hypothetical protein [Sporosalibacterium faouarense]|uniref:hypothetical protein n=1 Tax=Sporosalibacterium faouarense TaxID=516123 RepID=UPI00192A6DAE|nr:hypothetical protein [Sporosalibacterium faouarense]